MFGDLAGECESEVHQLKQLVVKMDYCKDRIQQAAEQELKCRDPRYMRFDLPMKQSFLQHARNMQEKWTKKLQKYNHKYQDLLLQVLHRPQPASVQPSEACPLCLEDNEEVPLCANLGDYVNANGARQGHGVCTACLPSYLETGRNTCLMCREPYGDQWLTLRQQYGFEQDDVVMEDAWSSNLPLEFDNGMSPGSVYAVGAVVWSLNEEDYRFTGIAPSDPSALTIGRGRIGSSSLSMDFTPQLLYRIDFDVYGSHSVYRPAAEIAIETTEVPPDPVDAQIRVFHSAIVLDDFLWSGTVLRRIPVATPTAFYLVALHSYYTQDFLFFRLASSGSIGDGLHPEVLRIHQEASAQGPQVSESRAFPTWCAPSQPLVVEDSKSWRLPVLTWKRGDAGSVTHLAENVEETNFSHRAGFAELLALYHLSFDVTNPGTHYARRGRHQQIVHYLLELLAPSQITGRVLRHGRTGRKNVAWVNIEYGDTKYTDTNRNNTIEIKNAMESIETPKQIRHVEGQEHWIFKIPRNVVQDVYDGSGIVDGRIEYSKIFNIDFTNKLLQLITKTKEHVRDEGVNPVEAVKHAAKLKLVYYCLSTALCLRIVESMKTEKNPKPNLTEDEVERDDHRHGTTIVLFVNILRKTAKKIRDSGPWPTDFERHENQKRKSIKTGLESIAAEAELLVKKCDEVWENHESATGVGNRRFIGKRYRNPHNTGSLHSIPLQDHFCVTNSAGVQASDKLERNECNILQARVSSGPPIDVGFLDLVPEVSVFDSNIVEAIQNIQVMVDTGSTALPAGETFKQYQARKKQNLASREQINQILAENIAVINTFLDNADFLHQVTKAIYDNDLAKLNSTIGKESFSFSNFLDLTYPEYLLRYNTKLEKRENDRSSASPAPAPSGTTSAEAVTAEDTSITASNPTPSTTPVNSRRRRGRNTHGS